ncbi:hypothetical protein DFP72DRAFT_498158 [Ephemerocybe angulata]|uniref:Transmembrane protein n=1 Tax=Ephemerocybe angulata TaxID=980116 RepID=A0A8H6HSN1_9AGAR|nr:hypothetical protein DFP72DRAFT_498158 [Tulosesus angulatus]
MAKIEPVADSASRKSTSSTRPPSPKEEPEAADSKPSNPTETLDEPQSLALVPLGALPNAPEPVNSEPKPISAPFIYNPSPQPKRIRRRTWPLWVRRPWRILLTILSGLWRVLYIFCICVGVAVLASIILGLSFGLSAANGAIFMLIGNAILRAAHLPGYTGNPEAAAVGAVGGIFAVICIGIVFSSCVPQTEMTEQGPQHAWYFRMAATVLAGTVTGPIGCSIMRRHMDLKGLDVLHATRAGAVGGAVMGVGNIVIFPILLLAIGILLTPLWIAMAMGLEFIVNKSNETWGENSHSYSHCYCYGSCGEPDEEMQEEIQEIRALEERHRQFGDTSRLSHLNHF